MKKELGTNRRYFLRKNQAKTTVLYRENSNTQDCLGVVLTGFVPLFLQETHQNIHNDK